MESIIFYKLNSPYPEDVTKDCNLTVTDMDSNFLAFKNNDLSAATFDNESYSIDLTKNDGEKISIDVSEIREYIEQRTSGSTSGDTPTLEDMSLELTSKGVLTLSWIIDGQTSTSSVSGIVTTIEGAMVDTTTIDGSGVENDPLRLSNIEKTSAYKNVISIVEELPSGNVEEGDRYITSKTVSDHGFLYTHEGVGRISDLLTLYGLKWRIPTKEDWDNLFMTLDTCNDGNYHTEGINVEQGKYIGSLLKSRTLWNEEDNSDIIGFSVFPTYSADEFRSLVDGKQNAIFWTDTRYSGDTYYTKEFAVSSTTVTQNVSEDNHMYAVRLVMDYDSLETGFEANILGDSYRVINVPQIKQLWIASNLDYNLGSDNYGIEFEYDGNVINTKYYINHFNGLIWEKRQLDNGDTVTVGNSGYIKEYKVFDDYNGNSSLAKSCDIKNGRVILDSGWY